MNSGPVTRLTGPEGRASLYYFCLFMGNGVTAAYLPIWLALKGLSGEQIGYVNAAPIACMIAFNLFVGRLADRAPDWRQAIVLLSLLSGIAPIGLFFVNGFWGIAILYTLTMVPVMAASPVADAASIRMTRRRGTDFAFIRAWGTLGFMSMNTAMGVFASLWGAVAFLPLFAGSGLARAAAALQLPAFRAPQGEREAQGGPAPARLPTRLLDALKPWFVLTLFGGALIFCGHLILQGFAALVWKNAGISEALIGALVAVSALAEAIMMFAFRRIAARFSARHLILVAGVTLVVRLAAMAIDPPVAVLFVLQSLHAITFALGYLGTVNFIANWTSEDIAAEAQSFYTVVQLSISVLAVIGFGYLFSAFGSGALLGGSALAVCGVVCVALSLRLHRVRAAASDAPVIGGGQGA